MKFEFLGPVFIQRETKRDLIHPDWVHQKGAAEFTRICTEHSHEAQGETAAAWQHGSS